MNIETTRLALAAVIACAAIGCETGDTGGAPGPIMRWMPTDSGIPPRPDAAVGYDAETGPMACVELLPLGEAELPRCTAATRDCVSACPAAAEGNACRDACWRGDEMPEYYGSNGPITCIDCVFRKLIQCLDEGGCSAEVDAYLCCIVERCAGADNTCIETMCSSEATSMFTCGGYGAPECFDVVGGSIGECYAPAEGGES
jgi:hypothetical protein